MWRPEARIDRTATWKRLSNSHSSLSLYTMSPTRTAIAPGRKVRRVGSVSERCGAPHHGTLMRLKADIPAPILQHLAEVGVDASDIVLSLSCDIDLLGRYGRQWVLATSRQLRVYGQKDPLEPRIVLDLSDVAEFRTLAVVGSGLLQAKVDGVWVDLVRYSNRRKYWFGRLARRLEQLREGESIELEPEDDHDPRRCPSCGLTLAFAKASEAPRRLMPARACLREEARAGLPCRARARRIPTLGERPDRR